MSVYLRKRKTKQGFSYYLDIWHDGIRWYESLGLRNHGNNKLSLSDLENTAMAARAQREMELRMGTNAGRPKQANDIDFFVYFQSRIDKYQGKNKFRLIGLLNTLKEFYKHPRLPFRSLTPTVVKDFRKHLVNKYHGETPSHYFTKFRSILKEAIGDGHIEKNPADGIVNSNPVANDLRKKVLFDDEVNKLASTPCGNLEIRRAFLFSCMTGLRLCDVRKLKWSDIDFEKQSISIGQQKTKKQVNVLLNPSAIKLLGNPPPKPDLVFNLKITDNGINETIKTWVSRAGIKKHITYGCSRHSFITNVYFHTGNLKLAGSLAGHSTTRHTEKYVHLIDQSRRDAVNSLPDLLLDAN